MTAIDIIMIVASVLIISAAVVYIIFAKRSGKKCIGCPDSGSCRHEKVGSYSCAGNCSSCHACRTADKSGENNKEDKDSLE